mgnify:CR=1 FL=1
MSQKLKEKDYFKSSDISLCAALCYLGYQIESIEKVNPSKAIFVIEKDEKLEEIIKLFFAHQLQVDPLGYFNFLKEIKVRIYNI